MTMILVLVIMIKVERGIDMVPFKTSKVETMIEMSNILHLMYQVNIRNLCYKAKIKR